MQYCGVERGEGEALASVMLGVVTGCGPPDVDESTPSQETPLH